MFLSHRRNLCIENERKDVQTTEHAVSVSFNLNFWNFQHNEFYIFLRRFFYREKCQSAKMWTNKSSNEVIF